MTSGIDRRAFLEQSLLAAGALSLGPLAAPAASQPSLERKGPPKKVIVVGAGLAGLSAAYELVGAGHDVTILEARTRPGGRVLTLREPFSNGLYAEAGAIFIHDNHDWTMRYVELFDLDLDPVVTSELASVGYLRGQRIVMRPGEVVDWPLELTAEERRLGRDGMWEKYVGTVVKKMGDPGAPDWPPEALAEYDGISFAELLRRQGASPDAVSLLSLGFPDQLGDGAESYSALNMLAELALTAGMKASYTIRGGNDRLPQAFGERLAERTHYRTPVVRIEHDAEGVRVVHEGAGGPASLAADHLVCAVPFSVLRHIEIAPPFSPDKQRAIDELSYTSVTRVYLQTRARFWLDEGLSGQALTDLPISGVSDRTATQPGPRGILESYRSGAKARKAASLSEAERLRSTLDHMAKVHPAVTEHYERGASVAWDENRWSRGGYIWFQPGEMTSLRPHIAGPEGRVHFAGEHASTRPGWMQGALESGNRVAHEINDAV